MNLAARDGLVFPMSLAYSDVGSVVAWSETSEDEITDVRAITYLVNTGWDEDSERLGSSTAWGNNPEVGMNAAGLAVAVWSEQVLDYNDPSVDIAQLWTSHHAPGGAWSAPTLLDESATQSLARAVLAVGDGGTAIAAWSRGGRISAAPRAPDTGWGQAVVVAEDPMSGPAIALDGQGNGLLLWRGVDPESGEAALLVRRYKRDGGWAASVEAIPGTANAGVFDFAIDGRGVPTAVWVERTGSRSDILASRYE